MRSTLTEKQQFWLDHVRACDESDQSMRAYAEANGLKAVEFYSWKATRRRKGASAKTNRQRQITGDQASC